jgi:hypothetical protein
MVDRKKHSPAKRTDQPPEEPKKLPEALPEKFDVKNNDKVVRKKRGKGARLHGSM